MNRKTFSAVVISVAAITILNPRLGSRPSGGFWIYSCSINLGISIAADGLVTYAPTGGGMLTSVPRERLGC